MKSAATLPDQEVSAPPTGPLTRPQLKMIGRSALTDRNGSEPAHPGLQPLLCPPLWGKPREAGSPSLTVLKAQDDVPQVEASLLLGEGLVAGYFHDRPVGRAGCLAGIRMSKSRWQVPLHRALQTP